MFKVALGFGHLVFSAATQRNTPLDFFFSLFFTFFSPGAALFDFSL